jgi:uncharacterized membrane protein YbaN (DUF454 family)
MPNQLYPAQPLIPSMSGAKKFGYIVLGTVSLALGIIGIIIPVLPTTPFILLTAWCYLRGSEKFHTRLLNHPRLGPIVEEYSDDRGMRKESKQKAILMTWVAVLLTATFILDTFQLRALVIGLAGIGTIVMLRLKTRD